MNMDERIFWQAISVGLAGAISQVATQNLNRARWKWFVYGILLSPIAAIHLAVLLFRERLDRTNIITGSLFIAGGLAVVGAGFYAYFGFSKQDIEPFSKEIRANYEKRGISIKSISVEQTGKFTLLANAVIERDGQTLGVTCTAQMPLQLSRSYNYSCVAKPAVAS